MITLMSLYHTCLCVSDEEITNAERKALLTLVYVIHKGEVEHTNILALRATPGGNSGQIPDRRALHGADVPEVLTSPPKSSTSALVVHFTALLAGGWCQRQRFITFNDVRMELIFHSYMLLDVITPCEPYALNHFC